jgi:two-component system chemotaxis response regulator CheY
MKVRPEAAALNFLIVDDQAVARKSVKRLLEGLGCQSIFEASSVYEATQIVENDLIEFIVVDMNLGEEKGTSLIEFVRQQDIANDIPILVVTGEAEREEIVRAVDFGASDYLLKPFHAEDFETKFNQLLDSYLKPDEVSRLCRNAERLLVSQRPTEALMYIEQASELDNRSLRPMHLRAMALFRIGQFDEPIRLLNEVVQSNPRHFRSHRLLADIRLKQGQISLAAQHLKSELELNPRSPQRQTLMGRILISQSRLDEAANHFREALKLENKLPEALFGMAQVNAGQENLEKALYYIKRIRRHHPKHRQALDLAMNIAVKFDLRKQVEILLRDEKSQHPNRLDVYQCLTTLYLESAEEDKTVEIANQIASNFPDDPEAQITLGDLAVRTKKFDAAVIHYKTAAVKGRSREGFKKLAKTLIHLKKWADAEKAATQLFGLKAPTEALRLLAEIYFKTKSFTQAHLMYVKLGRLTPTEKAPPAAESAAQMVNNRKKRKLGFAS